MTSTFRGKGLYFVAMVQAAAIIGKSPEGVPAKVTRAWTSRDAVITQEQAEIFQRIAWEALEAYIPGEIAAQITPAQPPPPQTPRLGTSRSAQDPPFPAFKPITNTHLALGLAGVNDWSVQQPFLNVMKTARPWIGHLPDQFGGWTEADLAKAGALGPNGWPMKIPPELAKISALILTDLPEDAAGVAGRYLLTYQGKGTLKVEGRAQVVEETPGRVVFDYTPGERHGRRSALLALDATDPIHDIVVVRASRAQMLADGAIFNPDWLARIRGVQRHPLHGLDDDQRLHLGRGEGSPLARGLLPTPATACPIEVMVALANELKADPWFTMPASGAR